MWKEYFFNLALKNGTKNPETVVVSGLSEPISFSVRNVGRVGRTRFCLCDGHLLSLVLRISPVGVPGECPRRRCAFVPRRPRPLAQVASSATGGAPIAPPTSYARRSHNPENTAPILPQQIKKTASRKADCLFWLAAPKKISPDF